MEADRSGYDSTTSTRNTSSRPRFPMVLPPPFTVAGQWLICVSGLIFLIPVKSRRSWLPRSVEARLIRSHTKLIVLSQNSASYFLGDAKNDSLQRVYGISFPDKKQLSEYKIFLAEAAKRDHRKIGRVRSDRME